MASSGVYETSLDGLPHRNVYEYEQAYQQLTEKPVYSTSGNAGQAGSDVDPPILLDGYQTLLTRPSIVGSSTTDDHYDIPEDSITKAGNFAPYTTPLSTPGGYAWSAPSHSAWSDHKAGGMVRNPIYRHGTPIFATVSGKEQSPHNQVLGVMGRDNFTPLKFFSLEKKKK